MEMRIPDQQTILNVRQLINNQVHQTPILTNTTLNQLSGCILFFKCENLQKAGAFKFRGASHALLTLSEKDRQQGVATHSSGNHAQALSLAARMQGVKAHIVMPENAPKIKVDAVRAYGGEITFCYPTLADRESTLRQVISRTGATEIHPYNDYRIIAGQATAAAELFEQAPGLDYLVAPVGGGGLLSGSILSAKYFSPATKVFGAEPENANDAWESFHKKRLIPVKHPNTVADGLRTSLGTLTFPIIRDGAEDILTTSEDAIINAMRLVWERMKVVVEPSAAVPLAAILDRPELFKGKRTGVIFSGGNQDLNNLPWLDSTYFSNH